MCDEEHTWGTLSGSESRAGLVVEVVSEVLLVHVVGGILRVTYFIRSCSSCVGASLCSSALLDCSHVVNCISGAKLADTGGAVERGVLLGEGGGERSLNFCHFPWWMSRENGVLSVSASLFCVVRLMGSSLFPVWNRRISGSVLLIPCRLG